jgi:hypothetical protein
MNMTYGGERQAKSSGGQYVPIQSLEYNTVIIFHDGEKCPLPKRNIVRNSHGNPTRDKKGSIEFNDRLPSYMGQVDRAKIYKEVLRTILTSALGNSVTEDEAVKVNTVRYYFLLCRRGPHARMPIARWGMKEAL